MNQHETKTKPIEAVDTVESAAPAFIVHATPMNVIRYSAGLGFRNHWYWQAGEVTAGRLVLRDGLLYEPERPPSPLSP